MRIVILGAPGAGKRTQAALLGERLSLSSVTTGKLLKVALAEQRPLALEAKALQDAGKLVTEDIILGLLRECLLAPAMAGGFILDGFPRNLLQAITLDEELCEIDQPLDLVLLIDIETEILLERLVGRRTCRSCDLLYNTYWNPPQVDGVCDACGGPLHQRTDDNEETVSNRVHIFDHLISPLIGHYEKSGKLVRIDGNGEIATVFKAISDATDRFVEQNRLSPAVVGIDALADQDEPPTEEKPAARRPAKQKKTVRKTSSKPKQTPNNKSRSLTKKRAATKKKVAKKQIAKKPTVKRVVKAINKTAKKGSGKKRVVKKTVTKKKGANKKVSKKR